MLKHDSSVAPVFGLALSRLDLEQALANCLTRVRDGQGGTVCFVNVHTATESTSDPALRRAFENATLLFADGVPLVWASRLKRQPIHSRVCGPDFMHAFLSRHPGLGHGFIGGKPGVAETLVERYQLKDSALYCPPFRPFSEENVAEDWRSFVAARGGKPLPPVVWVGLGAPKQELWMEAASRLSPGTLFFGVGAAFDFLSGTIERAPEWMQRNGLEWVHRFLQDPKRLGKRYLVTNTRFLGLLARDLMQP